MKKQPQVWEILVALVPIFIGISVWLYNMGTKVNQHEIRIETIEKAQSDYRKDVNDIKEKLTLILIRMENKQDRK